MSDQLPAPIDLTAYHGDTWSQAFRLKSGAAPVDLTGATVAAWAVAFTTGAIVELTATVTDAAAGELQIAIGPGGLPTDTYVYDVEVRQAGAITTWIRGTLTVRADITDPVGLRR